MQSEREVIESALKEALYLAVVVIAFIGRDKGTSRLDDTLEGLTRVALRTDPLIRNALDKLNEQI